jgi:hypothetical protein
MYGSVHFEAGADVIVQLLSEQLEDGTLGIGLQVTKNNDVVRTNLERLRVVRKPARPV